MNRDDKICIDKDLDKLRNNEEEIKKKYYRVSNSFN